MKMKEFAKKIASREEREEKEKAKRSEVLRMAMGLIENEDDDDDDYDIPFDVYRKCPDREHRSIHYYDYDDPTEAESLAYTIADIEAEKTAEAFLRLVDGNRKVIIGTMLGMITAEDAESGAAMLKGMFYAREMDYAAENLDIIEACSGYCDDVYDHFIDSFLTTEIISSLLEEELVHEAFMEAA